MRAAFRFSPLHTGDLLILTIIAVFGFFVFRRINFLGIGGRMAASAYWPPSREGESVRQLIHEIVRKHAPFSRERTVLYARTAGSVERRSPQRSRR